MICIYKILCIPTNEFYIGSTVNFSSRKAGHLCLLRGKRHPNPILQSKFNYYKEENFIFCITEVCKKEELLKKEQEYIDNLNPKLNCNKIAGRPPKNTWNSISRYKMSLSKKGKKHKNKRIYTKEGLLKLIENNKKLFKEGKLGGIGENHPGKCLVEKEVILIKKLIEENILETKDIAKIFKVSYGCICDIKYNRSWVHLPATIKVNGRKKKRLSTENRFSKSEIFNKEIKQHE